MAKKDLVYGIRAVMETIRSGKDLEKVFIQKSLKGDLIEELRVLVKAKNVPFSVVPVEKLNRLIRGNHQGVVAQVSPIQYYPLDQVISQCYEKGVDPLLVALDGITDVRNLGSIARTAECMGAHGLIIPVKGGAQINADAIKTSAGALNFIPVIRQLNFQLTIEELRQHGLKVVVCTEKTNEEVRNADLKGPVCVVMGAEDVGVAPEIMHLADEKVRIPTVGKIASLNVGSACSMILYEVLRQRLE